MSGGHIPEDVIEDVRSRSDIVAILEGYLPLKRRGADFWACCPFHKEKTPSFKVSPARQAFYCFGCHKGGNVFDFIKETENVDFPGAVRLLANRAGIIIPETDRQGRATGAAGGTNRSQKERIHELLTAVARWYQQLLHERMGEPAREYLAKRAVPDEVAVTFGLGYSPDSWDATLKWAERQGYDAELVAAAGLSVVREEEGPRRCYDRFRGRLMFPIWDELGRVVGFSARVLSPTDQGAKYINTPETAVFHKGRLLYALHLARQHFKDADTALICEGQLDVIACHRAGLTQAVAPQGTAFTETHALLLKRYASTVVLSFDGDTAGEKAAVRSVQVALQAGLKVKVVTLPEKTDPDSLFRTAGPEALRQVVATAQDASAFLLGLARRHYDAQSPEGRVQIAHEVLEALAVVADPMARATYAQWLAAELSLPESAVFESLSRMLKESRRPAPEAGTARGPQEPPRATAAGAAKAMEMSVVDRAQLMLLDLALNHGFIAHQLAEKLPPDVGEGPISKALHLVIGLAASDQWAEAGKRLAADPVLAQVPAIARVLVDPEFPPFDPAPVDEQVQARLEARLLKATADCLAKLERHCLDVEIRDAETALSHEPATERARELMRRLQSLQRQRAQLSIPATTGQP